MRAVLLVPRRAHPERDKLWAYCRDRWTRYFPDLAIYEGHHNDGPFNRSAAINTAARLADADGRWDVGVVIDADILIPESQARAAIKSAGKGKVTWGHRRWRGFHEDHTKRVLAKSIDFGPQIDREDMDLYVERTTPRSWSCFIAIPRKVWDEIGGFDERFVGWGYEDMAFKSLITGLYPWTLTGGDVYHLFHPRSEERIVKGQPGSTASRAYVQNARLGRRYMVAAYRDHGAGDEPGESLPDALRTRHVANLMKDDHKLNAGGFPDWSKWWPTLEELRDGAIEFADQQARGVTVVVTSGGTADTWTERSAYLRASLASLAENLSGPIVQRVVYSDWPPEFKAELETIANEHGFYVAGEGQHGHTGMRQRLWRYLSKRAQGPFIFATEDDFLYTAPVDLTAMVDTLRDNAHLVQVALLRDACYQDERETGGILGWPEPAFTRHGDNGTSWLEHNLFWTNNPSVFRRELTSTPWPEGRHSETIFGKRLLANSRKRAAFWGDGSEWVKHIGQVRAGVGY